MQMNDECFKLLVYILENTPDQNYYNTTFGDRMNLIGVETAKWVGHENGHAVMINHKLGGGILSWRLAYCAHGKHCPEYDFRWHEWYTSPPKSEGWRRITKDDYELALSIVKLGEGFKKP